MKTTKTFGWRHLAVLLVALACAGSWAAGQVRSMRDRSGVDKMTEKMKTVCVGRYLVDVPAQTEVNLSHQWIDGFAIETVEENDVEFQKRIAAREAEIQSRGVEAGAGGPGGIIEAHDLRIPGMVGRTIVYGHTRSHGFEKGQRVDVEWVSVESHAHIGDLSFSLSAKYVDETAAAAAEALLARLRLRGENEIPAAPGFCVWRAVLVEPLPLHKNEQVAMHLSVPDHPDLALTLFSVAGGNPSPSLLARVARMDADASPDEMLRVTKLRSDRRRINGLGGEEVVERIREFNFTTTYTFNWETSDADEDLLLPYLSLEAQAGIGDRPGAKPSGASLQEDALLTLWDRISSTIRLRKTTESPAVKPVAPAPG